MKNWAKDYFTEEQYNIWCLKNIKCLLLMWGRGSGKSEILQNIAIRESSKENRKIWILAPTEADVIRIYAKRISYLLKNVWQWKENKKRDFESDDDGLWYLTNRKTLFEFKNGSSISLISSDRAEKNEGDRCSLIILDEFAKFKKKDEFYSIYIPSLSPSGKLIIASTPKGKEEYWQIAQKAKNDKSGTWKYSYATAYSNTKYFEYDDNGKKITWADKIKADMDIMPLWQWEQEYLCEVSAVEGRCIPEFKDEYNTINLPINYFKEYPLNIGMDFNRSPFSVSLFQCIPKTVLDEKYPEILKGYYDKLEEYKLRTGKTKIDIKGFQDDIIFFIGEISKNNMDVEKMLPIIDDYLESIGFNKEENKIVFYGDVSGNQRTANAAKSLWEIIKDNYSNHIFRIPKSNPSHYERVTVTGKKVKTAGGKIGLLVNDKCENIIDDFQQVVWKAGTWEIDKDKYDAHMFDACSYGIQKIYGYERKPKKEQIRYINLNIYGNEHNVFSNVNNGFVW